MNDIKHGDLSARVSPRLLLVFEGALGFCTDLRRFNKATAKKNWEQAAGYWELNELMVRQILWLYHRKDLTIEVVTFQPEYFAVEVKYLLDAKDIPVHRVWSTTPENLSRQIAYMPDLACVYDPEPERWAMYGGKGQFLTNVAQLGEGVGYGQR